MSEGLPSINNLEWHNHDMYEGAGGEVLHAHANGKSTHEHDWTAAVPTTEEVDIRSRQALENSRKIDTTPEELRS